MKAVAAVRRALRPHIRRARSRWRRSLLLRVIAATVALGVLVLLVVGQLLLQDKVAHRVSLTGRALSVASQTLAAERTAVTLQGSVYYQVLDVERADAEADHLVDVVLGQLLATLRRDAANRDQASDRELNGTLKRDLTLELRSHGVVVTRCQLQRDAA